MQIRRYESPLLKSNMYIVTEGRHAIVLDPFQDISPAEGLVIDKIILTHEHYDHISGVNLWKEKTRASVLCSAACAENIKYPTKNLSRIFEVFCGLQTWVRLETAPKYEPGYTCTADEIFTDKFSFGWAGHQWELFEIPGHSRGSIGIMLDESCFFSGDSLLEHDETETRLPGGSTRQWTELGRPRLERLPEGIRVCPGHFKEFTYSKERT